MSFISTSALLTDTKLSSFIPEYILKVFTEGFVDISFGCFFIALYIFVSVDLNYNTFYISLFCK